jgi:hypothetical protein
MEPRDVLQRRDELLFWIMLEYRYGWLACDCVACEAEQGIPLARVWLTGQGECRVLAIHDQAPYRRPLQPAACLPAPRNNFNLGQVIGQDVAEATRTLIAAGLPIAGEIPVTAGDWSALRSRLEWEAKRERGVVDTSTLFAERGRSLTLHYLEAPDYGGKRLVWLD